jgi:two-component system LytT family sensor kinase
MSHPFTSQRRALIIYSLIWVVIAIIYAIFLRFNKEFSLTVAFSDALLGSILFGLLGLIIWYPIRYIPFRKEAPIYSISAHVAAGLIVILAWLFISVGILGAIFSTDEKYRVYLSSSLYLRGIVGVMLYLVMVLIYYLVSYARTLRERGQAEEKLRTLVKESELNLLKSQINPHFLFNSLNSISSLIMSSPEEAREMIVRLSDFLRYSLKHRENEFVSIEEEIGRMNDYLLIERIRFGDKLSYRLDTSEECKNLKVPTMIMQPLIENAIKHGVYESLEPVSVEFKCKVKKDLLKLELTNNFDPESPSKSGTGVGLQNVSERIRLTYDGEGSVIQSSKNGVFTVILYIPLDKKSDS